MAEVRSCVYFSVLVLCFHVAVAKPMFGLLWCDLICEEDDVSTTSTTTTSDYDEFWCGGCFPTRRTTTTPNPMVTPPMNQPNGGGPFNLMIPPANGMNVTMWRPNDGGAWWMNFVPWGPGGGAGAPPQGATTQGPAAAAPTTPGAPTTAAGAAATTVAPTTAAGK